MAYPFGRAGQPARHRELPPGLADRLPAEARRLHAVRETCLVELERWGYRLVVTPLLEHADTFEPALPDPGDETFLYRFVDRTTGHVLAIRADFTPQVARVVGTRFHEATLPLRLCYEGSVVRHVPERRGMSREIPQVGAELVGVIDPEADAEGIALVVACLRAAGVGGFKVDLGQVEFFRGIVDDLDLSAEALETLRNAVARKDLSDLDRILSDLPIPDRRKEILAELPLLAGGTEVLDRASDLVDTDHSLRALENLARVVELVGVHGLAEHITVDLGEIRGIDYHTGVIYEAFVPHVATPLVRGGRYDRLCGAYGRELAATGFSLDLAAVLAALGPSDPRPEGVFLINFEPDRRRALLVARRLRGAGVRAARDLIRRPLDDSLAHAKAQGFRWALVVDPEVAPRVRWIDLVTGGSEVLTEEDAASRAGDAGANECRT
ncbi:ATP phosphoribosyltransferase regulatory subunit [Deferrisoma camini]|uniref:ATP phosphoribosyltransferase regulatory subunit n=1 Tax=Deferrisoma camini TaxID=1035120 RepID=UPI00046C970F|nr:ATP phosphoribosyltransferase regulatory subunit [Deferrisoma camini]